MSDDRQYAPATLRNRDFILDVLRDVLPTTGVILEIASGRASTSSTLRDVFQGSFSNRPILIPMHGSVSPPGARRQASRMYTRRLP
jgi:Protein of unknown function (DUF938)